MAIILRTVKGSELTFAEVDGNFQSLFYSSSLDGTNLILYTTGSTSQSVDLSSISGGDTGSLMVTGSILNGTLTFTKGDSSTFDLIYNTGSFTGSFVGDGSGLTSVAATTATTSSYALTASYVENAQTASYVTTAQTASFVTTAQTASYVENAQTASYVTTAQTASFVTTAQTASYIAGANVDGTVANATSASHATSGNGVFSGSFSGSFEGDGSGLTGLPIYWETGSGEFSIKDINSSSTIATAVSFSIVAGGTAHDISSGNRNAIVGGFNHSITSSDSNGIVGGRDSIIDESSNNNFIGGGDGSIISGSSVRSAHLGGNNNTINSGTNSAILASQNSTIGGASCSEVSLISAASSHIYLTNISSVIASGASTISSSNFGTIIGGSTNNINKNQSSPILGGISNTISSDNLVIHSANSILGGNNNTISESIQSSIISSVGSLIQSHTGSAIIGGQSITASANNTVYVPNLVATGSITGSSFTGSFVGDGSGLTGITADTATTASYVETAQTASFVTTAQTASYVTTAQTASFVSLVAGPNVTINQAGTNFEISSSVGSTFPFNGDALITGSLTVSGSAGKIADFTGLDAISGSTFSGSFVGDGSGLTGLVSSSYALTASYVENAQTASFVTTAQTASFVSLVAGPNVTINQAGTSFEISGSAGGGTSYWEETTSTIKLDTGETTRDVVEINTGGANTLSGTYSQGNLLVGDGNTFGNGQIVRRAFIGGNAVVVGASEAFQTSIVFGQTITVEGTSTSVFGASHVVKGNYNFTAGQNNDLFGDNLTSIGTNNILGETTANINRSIVIGEDADSYADDQIVIGFGIGTNSVWGAAKAIYVGIENSRANSGWFTDPNINTTANFALGGNNTMRTDIGIIKAGAGAGIFYLVNYNNSNITEPTVDLAGGVAMWAKDRAAGVAGLTVKDESGGKSWIGGRIGANQVTPTATIHATGEGTTSGTTGLLVEDSGNNATFKVTDDGVSIFKSFAVASLPTAVAGGFIYVSDETGGATMAFSDGTNWRRVQDRAIVS